MEGTPKRAITYDLKLQHELELLLGHTETFWCQVAGASRDWKTFGFNAVSNVMHDRVVRGTDLSESWEFPQQVKVRVASVL